MNQRQNRAGQQVVSGVLVAILLASSLLTARAANLKAKLTIDPPQLSSPPNGAETTGNPDDPNIASRMLYEPLGIPTFEWEDVGASKYKLEVATTAAFGSSVVLRLDNLEYTKFTPYGEGEQGTGFSLTETSGSFTDSATFYWHVQAWDDTLGQWSDWSPTWSFVRHWGYQVQLTLPADGSVQTETPYFTWEPVPGASFYQIQVDSSSSFGALLVDKTVDVPVYTPVETFQNDTDLFWRVRAFHRPNSGDKGGGYGGPWSEVREFQMAWSSKVDSTDKRPLQLVPPDNATFVGRPLFCWKPVAGARKYAIDISTHPEFVAGSFLINDKKTEGTCFNFERDGTFNLDFDTTYYWRVTAIDAKDYRGQRTDTGVGSTAFQFRTAPSEPLQVPTHLYPPPYYESIMADTFEDRTMAMPTFVWDHVRGATAYELRLDDEPAMTDPATVIVTTTNASFTFTDTATYPLNDGDVYYWRVRALGAPQGTPDWWEMTNGWPVRIDRSLVHVTDTVKLIQPTFQSEPWTSGYKYGLESVTYYPSFSWTAVAPIGDATYQIQIAHDSAFSSLVHDAQTEFVEYTPLERPEPGTYFWRVRQVAPVTGSWSSTGRFIVSRNFTFVGDPIAVDGESSDWGLEGVPFYAPSGEDGDASSTYDMSGFYIANDSVNWYFGIDLPPSADLGLYFDIDHFDLSGGAQPPTGEGADPNWPDAHRPEFAIYWATDRTQGQVYEWNGSSWTNRGPLSNILASSAYSTTTEFLELAIPVTQLDQPGSLSVMLVTMDGSGTIQDKLPNRPGSATQAAFLTESTTPTPLYPANAPQEAALSTVERNTPVLTWRHNEDGAAGTFFFETFEDETLTNLYEGEQGNAPKKGLFWDYNTFWAPLLHYSDNNSYHWLIRRGGFEAAAPTHFRKQGFIPINLQFSPIVVSGTMTYTNRTPSFTWQPAQSAPKYVWQLWESGVLKQEKTTMVPYYTPQNAIEDGTYTWKVYARDARDRNSAEAAQGEFRKVSDVVPVYAPEYTTNTLELRWQPVDYAAYYKIEIADDPQFSRNFWSKTTYNTTFTPRTVPKATEDGVFYWRVYLFDNQNHAGPYIDLRFDPYPQKIYLPTVIR